MNARKNQDFSGAYMHLSAFRIPGDDHSKKAFPNTGFFTSDSAQKTGKDEIEPCGELMGGSIHMIGPDGMLTGVFKRILPD